MTSASLAKKIATRGIIGAAGGIAIGVIFEMFFSVLLGGASQGTYTPGVSSYLAQFPNELTAVVVARLIYALLGAIDSVASLIFENERLSILSASLLHLVVIMGATLFAGWILHWWDVSTALGFSLVFLLVYAVIWIAIYLVIRKQIKAANEHLREKHLR